MSFGGEAAGTGFRVPKQRKGMGEDLLKKLNQTSKKHAKRCKHYLNSKQTRQS